MASTSVSISWRPSRSAVVTSRMSLDLDLAPEQVADRRQHLDLEAGHPAELAQLGDQRRRRRSARR